MNAAKPLFGIETEYGIVAPDGRGDEAVDALLTSASRSIPSLPSCSQGGIYLADGIRVYKDCGHPEIATPEVSTPDDAVAYVGAGERILLRLVEDHAGKGGERLAILRGNVDYLSGTTFGRHESYLHKSSPTQLAEQLLPHIVSRVVFGAGGFKPGSEGIEFTLSSRAAFFSTDVSTQSTVNRGIIHTKQEPLCGHGYRRFHVICPGDTLLSETGIYLNVATTALLVALVDSGERPGDAVQLNDPVEALRTFAADPTCRRSVVLRDGGTATVLDVQRHYLEWVERRLDAPCLPPWARTTCARWREILDRLTAGPEAVAGILDWATKRVVYEHHAGSKGFTWASLSDWTKIVNALHVAMKKADVGSMSCEQALLPDSPIRATVEALAVSLAERRASWDRLRPFVDLRAEFHELDTRWGELRETGIWEDLDTRGLLAHRILPPGAIERAVTEPPAGGRAQVRGRLILEAHRAGATRMRCEWDRVVDEPQRRAVDLSDPFETQAEWTPLKRVVERKRRRWPEILLAEQEFAHDRPEHYRQLTRLSVLLERTSEASRRATRQRRVCAVIEESFPSDHAIRGAAYEDLADALDYSAGGREADALRDCASAIRGLNERRERLGSSRREIALACNEVALCYRRLGKPASAEPLLREAVAIETATLPHDHPRRPHRHGNLASVLLMQNKRGEAGEALAQAWALTGGVHDLTSARILCLRIALDWMEGQDARPFLGQLKTLFAGPELETRENIATHWDVHAFRDALRPHLSAERFSLLTNLTEVLNDRAIEPQLDGHTEWVEAEPVALTKPWAPR